MLTSPSLLSCDFSDIRSELKTISEADMLHLDVMDGHFVPNISIGIPIVKSIRKATEKILDVHLMITDPEKYIPAFAEAGADIITAHIEASADCAGMIKLMRNCGVKPSLSVKPGTPAEALFPYLDSLYMVLVMTVEPGFGGQSMIPECLDKVKTLKTEAARRGIKLLVEADGGINEKTLSLVKESGVDIAVLGSAVFAKRDRNAFLRQIKAM